MRKNNINIISVYIITTITTTKMFQRLIGFSEPNYPIVRRERFDEDVIKSIIAEVLGTHLDNFQKIVIDPASITVLDFDGSDFRILTLNNTTTPIVELAKASSAKRATRALLGGGSGKKSK